MIDLADPKTDVIDIYRRFKRYILRIRPRGTFYDRHLYEWLKRDSKYTGQLLIIWHKASLIEKGGFGPQQFWRFNGNRLI